jgi:hypothetical protein
LDLENPIEPTVPGPVRMKDGVRQPCQLIHRRRHLMSKQRKGGSEKQHQQGQPGHQGQQGMNPQQHQQHEQGRQQHGSQPQTHSGQQGSPQRPAQQRQEDAGRRQYGSHDTMEEQARKEEQQRSVSPDEEERPDES